MISKRLLSFILFFRRERERDFLCFRSGQRDGAAACIGPRDGLRSMGGDKAPSLVLQDRQLVGTREFTTQNGANVGGKHIADYRIGKSVQHMQRRGALRSHGSSHFQKPLGLSVNERLAQVSLLSEIQSQKQEKLLYPNYPNLFRLASSDRRRQGCERCLSSVSLSLSFLRLGTRSIAAD